MKELRGRGELVLYLDFDGVLHHEDVWWHPRRGAYINTPGYRLFEHVPLLEDALLPFPEVSIVLSTSWVRVRRFSPTVKRLSPTLRQRVIGATHHTKMNPQGFQQLPRGVQVLNDALRRAPRQWLAIDDVTGWPPHASHQLIQTDGVLGISGPGVLEKLKSRLQQPCEHP